MSAVHARAYVGGSKKRRLKEAAAALVTLVTLLLRMALIYCFPGSFFSKNARVLFSAEVPPGSTPVAPLSSFCFFRLALVPPGHRAVHLAPTGPS